MFLDTDLRYVPIIFLLMPALPRSSSIHFSSFINSQLLFCTHISTSIHMHSHTAVHPEQRCRLSDLCPSESVLCVASCLSVWLLHWNMSEETDYAASERNSLWIMDEFLSLRWKSAEWFRQEWHCLLSWKILGWSFSFAIIFF